MKRNTAVVLALALVVALTILVIVRRTGTTSVLPSPADATPVVYADASCSKSSYDENLTRAHELAAAGRKVEAILSFDEAVRARPYDARARIERAEVRGEKESLSDLELARVLTRDRELLRRVNEMLARSHEAGGDSKKARLAWIDAETNGSEQAKRRLGDASRCTVEVDVDKHEDIVMQDSGSRFHTQAGDPLERDGALLVRHSPSFKHYGIEGHFTNANATYRDRGEGWTDRAHCIADETRDAWWLTTRPEGDDFSLVAEERVFDIYDYFDARGSLRASVRVRGVDSKVSRKLDGGVLEVSGSGCSLRVPVAVEDGGR